MLIPTCNPIVHLMSFRCNSTHSGKNEDKFGVICNFVRILKQLFCSEKVISIPKTFIKSPLLALTNALIKKKNQEAKEFQPKRF